MYKIIMSNGTVYIVSPQDWDKVKSQNMFPSPNVSVVSEGVNVLINRNFVSSTEQIPE